VARGDVPCPPGRRCFRYDVPASGEVRAEGPALLERVPDFRLLYADGAPPALHASGSADAVGGGAEGTAAEPRRPSRVPARGRPEQIRE
jgi:hypothetical protein